MWYISAGRVCMLLGMASFIGGILRKFTAFKLWMAKPISYIHVGSYFLLLALAFFTLYIVEKRLTE